MVRHSGSHAEHRPPGPPPTQLEAFYPTGDIVAATKDRTQAEAIVQALRGLGFTDDDLDILEPTFVIRAAEELECRRGMLGRLGAIFGDDAYLPSSSWSLLARDIQFFSSTCPTERMPGVWALF